MRLWPIGSVFMQEQFDNAAAEARVRSLSEVAKCNVTQSKAFSERLGAIPRYLANAITTAQVLEELMQLAKDFRAERARGR